MANKAQFNVKEAKEFRAIMGKYADACGAINTRIMQKQDFVNGRKSVIASNLDAIEGRVTSIGKTVEELIAENNRLQSEIESASKELAEFKSAQSDRLNSALNLITEPMYKAYSEFIMDSEDGDKYEKYATEVSEFLSRNGVVVGDCTVSALCASNGNNEASAKKSYKTGKETSANSRQKFAKIFLKKLVDIMRSANALPEYKYAYIPLKEREKSAK